MSEYKTVEKNIKGKLVIVYPEYTTLSADFYFNLAKERNAIVLGGVFTPTQIIVVCTDGKQILTRAKVHLTSSEVKDGKHPGDEIWYFEIGDLKILPIICKEILYPEDYYWLRYEGMNLITHHIGYPMFDKVQYQSWNALQKAMSHAFECPILSSCGGEDTPLNLTRIYPTEEGVKK